MKSYKIYKYTNLITGMSYITKLSGRKPPALVGG